MENEMTDNFIPVYDLESMSEPQRQDYIRNVCKHMGVPDNLNLVALTYVDDGEGPSRLVAYAKRGATENVRNSLAIKISALTNQMIGGSIVFTATAVSGTGRQEISTGSKFIDGLTGTALDDAIMTAQTRALRRVTLQFIGAGVLDESEVNQRKLVQTVSAPVHVAPQPVAPPSNEPGKDITPEPTAYEDYGKVGTITTQALISEACLLQPPSILDEAKRLQTIEQLNAQADAPKVKKTRKKRATVDLGPSEPVIKAAAPEPPAPVAPAIATVPVEPKPAIQAAVPAAPPTVKKPRLSQDQIRPFRERLFRLRNDYLETSGLAPKEGMGIADQLRSLAQIMFTGISDMNDLTVEQWEKYLSTLENKVKNDGPQSAVKFIEETIGL
jgi:hypothetical protein